METQETWLKIDEVERGGEERGVKEGMDTSSQRDGSNGEEKTLIVSVRRERSREGDWARSRERGRTGTMRNEETKEEVKQRLRAFSPSSEKNQKPLNSL